MPKMTPRGAAFLLLPQAAELSMVIYLSPEVDNYPEAAERTVLLALSDPSRRTKAVRNELLHLLTSLQPITLDTALLSHATDNILHVTI